MGKERSEVIREKLLQSQFEAGTANQADLIRLVEEVKSYRAQQKTRVYALWGLAGFSAVLLAFSLVISLKH
jgi:hypothetical protein